MSINKIVQNFLKSIKKSDKPPLIVILGPTASGKTALSLNIAQKFNGEIISADSRQIFKEMNIATDKILAKDQRNIPHHMIDIVSPEKKFTVADFKRKTLKIIREIIKRGKIPLLVGGTGLYIDAITKNFQIPKVLADEKLRSKLKKEFDEKGGLYLLNKLAKLDPASAKKIDPRNHRYLIRALEINLLKGKKTAKQGKKLFQTLKIGISWPRDVLYERINNRVDEQIKRGLLDEAQKMLERYDDHLPSMTSLGYPQLIDYFAGKMTMEQAKELLKARTRQYAKRQLTWFRRDKEIVWVEGNDIF